MVDIKTISISSLSTLGIVIIAMLTPTFFDEPKYYCETRPELGVVSCDDFSKYVATNGKCIRNEDTNLICRDGWLEVIDDRELPEETEPPQSINQTKPVSEGGGTWICPPLKPCERVI